MTRPDEGTWYELRPNGQPSIAVGHPRRYRTQPEAEEAAAEMRRRSPDFRFVEVVSYEMRNGDRSWPAPVARI